MWIWCNMFMLELWVDRVGYIVTYICIHLYISRSLAAPSIYVYIIYTFFYIYLTFTHPGLINWGRSSALCHFGLKEGRSHPGNLRKVPTQPALWRKLQGGLISRHPTCSRNFSVFSWLYSFLGLGLWLSCSVCSDYICFILVWERPCD